MGSGSKRKSNDHVRVNVPAKATGSGGGAAIAEASNQPDINQSCPLAFGVKLKNDVAVGLTVTIVGHDMVVAGAIIGTLPSPRIKQLSFCMSNGIRYTGKTQKDKDKKSYVKFEQVR